MPLATSWTPWTIFVALVQVALIEVIDYCTSILIQMPEPVKCQPRREPVGAAERLHRLGDASAQAIREGLSVDEGSGHVRVAKWERCGLQLHHDPVRFRARTPFV